MDEGCTQCPTTEDAPLFSVLLCNYNYGRYLSKAIKSVLSQTQENLELVVVDDGSSDSSRDVIASFDDPRLVVILQENAGQAAAFNVGYAKCNGEFVAFLDSDDFWDRDKLSKVLPCFEDESVCMVQHHLRVVDKESCDLGRLQARIKPGTGNILNKYLRKNHTGFFVATSGMVCRKNVLDKIFPLDVDWKICADVAFTRPLPLFGKIHTLAETLGGYRVHGGNNWVNTEQQGEWQANQKKYVEYTNSWLEKCGYRQQLDFEKSGLYRRHVLKNKIPGMRSFCNFLFNK